MAQNPQNPAPGPQPVHNDDLDALVAAAKADAAKAPPPPTAAPAPVGQATNNDIEALIAQAQGSAAPAAASADVSQIDPAELAKLAAETAAALDQQFGPAVTQKSAKIISDTPMPAQAPSAFQAEELRVPRGKKRDVSPIDVLDDVELDVRIELGRTEMYVEDILRLDIDSVVELDKLAGDPVDVFVNDQLVARGEVLVLNESYCVRINQIVSPVPELEADV